MGGKMELTEEQRQKLNAYAREYNKRPEVKERQKTRMQIYMREYTKRPEVKKKRKEYWKEYGKRPEVKQKRSEYNETYQDRAIIKLGGKCVNCGCTIMKTLDLNHINHDGKKNGKRESGKKVIQQILNDERNDIDVRCKVCNILYLWNHRGFNGWTVTWSPPERKALNTPVPIES